MHGTPRDKLIIRPKHSPEIIFEDIQAKCNFQNADTLQFLREAKKERSESKSSIKQKLQSEHEKKAIIEECKNIKDLVLNSVQNINKMISNKAEKKLLHMYSNQDLEKIILIQRFVQVKLER